MRTLLIIALGVAAVLLLLRYCPLVRRVPAMVGFSLVWLAVCAWNLSVGLSHGYPLGEELLVHVVLFGVPVALGWWRVRRGDTVA